MRASRSSSSRFDSSTLRYSGALRVRERHLRLADQHADGRAQFVREVRRKLQQALVAGFETVEHRVERRRQALQFSRRMRHVETRGQAVRRDLGGFVGHELERSQAAARGPIREQHRDERRADHVDPHANEIRGQHARFLRHHVRRDDLDHFAALADACLRADPAHAHAVGAGAFVQIVEPDRAVHRHDMQRRQRHMVGIDVDERRRSRAPEEDHVLPVAEHGFEETRARFDLVDRIKIVQQRAKVLHAPDQLIIGARGQRRVRRLIQRHADHADHDPHDGRERQRDAQRKRARARNQAPVQASSPNE